MATQTWGNTGSSNGLLHDGTKPLPEPMLTYHESICGIHLTAVSHDLALNLIRSEITLLSVLPHLPGTKMGKRTIIANREHNSPVLRCAAFSINTLRPRRNRRHFADDIFKCILLNENVLISIKISLKFSPNGPINNIPALVQIMAWHRPGDKPLSEPMMIISLTHICVNRPQWVNQEFTFCHFFRWFLPQPTRF